MLNRTVVKENVTKASTAFSFQISLQKKSSFIKSGLYINLFLIFSGINLQSTKQSVHHRPEKLHN